MQQSHLRARFGYRKDSARSLHSLPACGWHEATKPSVHPQNGVLAELVLLNICMHKKK